MARSRKVKLDDTSLGVSSQLDFFPVTPVVDVLDPRAVVGARTAVEHLVRVRPRANDTPHLVFHDRHGWYCETHGAHCPAVKLAQDAVSL